MPVEYFETEPTKKQPPDLLERVLDTTEHHEHAVDETNSDYMRQYRQGYEIGRMIGRARAAAMHQVGHAQRQSRAHIKSRLRSADARFLAWLLGVTALVWILSWMTVSSNRTPAAATQATPTPTPTVQKAEPHKATRGRRR